MLYVRTDSFKTDYKRLSSAEREAFKTSCLAFSEACDAYVAERQSFPASLRVKPVQAAPGIFEMTWSFSGPDGRATWQWSSVEVTVGRKTATRPCVLWRRVGSHAIFSNP